MTSLHLVLGTGPLGLATARALLARGHAGDIATPRAKALTETLASLIPAADHGEPYPIASPLGIGV